MRFWLTLVVVALAVGASRAQAPVKINLGGENLLVFRTTEFGRTPQERADQVENRLRTILGEPIRPGDIAVRPHGAVSAQIYVRGLLLVTLGPLEARENRSRAMPLARVWAKRLKKVLPRVSARRAGRS